MKRKLTAKPPLFADLIGESFARATRAAAARAELADVAVTGLRGREVEPGAKPKPAPAKRAARRPAKFEA